VYLGHAPPLTVVISSPVQCLSRCYPKLIAVTICAEDPRDQIGGEPPRKIEELQGIPQYYSNSCMVREKDGHYRVNGYEELVKNTAQ